MSSPSVDCVVIGVVAGGSITPQNPLYEQMPEQIFTCTDIFQGRHRSVDEKLQ